MSKAVVCLAAILAACCGGDVVEQAAPETVAPIDSATTSDSGMQSEADAPDDALETFSTCVDAVLYTPCVAGEIACNHDPDCDQPYCGGGIWQEWCLASQ